MKEPNWGACTEKELWQFVAHHLAENGLSTVLVGGGVIAVYTDGAYQYRNSRICVFSDSVVFFSPIS